MAVLYGVLALAGLVGTWYFNLSFILGPESELNYLQAWFANPASSSAAVDVIVAAVAACVFFVHEGIRLGWRWSWLFVPLTFGVALAFAFPLFLALRERALSRTASNTDNAHYVK